MRAPAISWSTLALFGGLLVQAPQPPSPARKPIEVSKHGFLRDEPVPVSDVNHKQYGVSSTPTLALLDREGIVRVYHSGRMTEEELDAAIRQLIMWPISR